MSELMEFAFTPPLIVYTILFMIGLVYCLTVLVGLFDFDTFDINLDIDIDADIDIDVDLDTDVNVSGNNGGSGFLNFLNFFNFGAMPFMILYTFLTMTLWAIAMLTHFYLSDGSWLFGLAVLIPVVFISLILTKILTTPLVKFFANFEEDTSVDFIGEIGNVTVSTSQTSVGRLEVFHKNRFFILKVLCEDNAPPLMKKGEKAMITRYEKLNDLYYVNAVTEL